ncbi:hypothetical protein GWI33_010872, partial [Rhynchophorus ferrugineus]
DSELMDQPPTTVNHNLLNANSTHEDGRDLESRCPADAVAAGDSMGFR